MDKANEAETILQIQCTRTFAKKDKPILKTYTTDQEQSRNHEIKPIKTDADQKRKLKTQTKNLEADFSDSTKPTRHFADKKKTY